MQEPKSDLHLIKQIYHLKQEKVKYFNFPEKFFTSSLFSCTYDLVLIVHWYTFVNEDLLEFDSRVHITTNCRVAKRLEVREIGYGVLATLNWYRSFGLYNKKLNLYRVLMIVEFVANKSHCFTTRNSLIL